jgi:hypothetical protein
MNWTIIQRRSLLKWITLRKHLEELESTNGWEKPTLSCFSIYPRTLTILHLFGMWDGNRDGNRENYGTVIKKNRECLR